MFENPLQQDGSFLDAIVIKPQESGFLYRSFDHSPIPGQLSWYIVRYQKDKALFEKQNQTGLFSGFRMSGDRVLQQSDAPLEKGATYILYFIAKNKEAYGNEPVHMTISLNLVKNKSVKITDFYKDR